MYSECLVSAYEEEALMRFRWLAVVALGLFISARSEAQVAVYGKLDLTRLADAAGQSSTWFYGPGAGMYWDFLHLGPIALGGDLRGSYGWGTQQNYRSALGGIRLVVRPPLLPIRPYVQGSVGIAGTKASSSNSGLPLHYDNKLAYEVLGGVDFTVFPYVDLRLPEVGYGRVSGVNGGLNAPSSTIFEISAGVVLRIP